MQLNAKIHLETNTINIESKHQSVEVHSRRYLDDSFGDFWIITSTTNTTLKVVCMHISMTKTVIPCYLLDAFLFLFDDLLGKIR